MLRAKQKTSPMLAIINACLYILQFKTYTYMLAYIDHEYKRKISKIKTYRTIKILEPKIGRLKHIKILLISTYQV